MCNQLARTGYSLLVEPIAIPEIALMYGLTLERQKKLQAHRSGLNFSEFTYIASAAPS
ncbi:MAG: hypothetical protein OXC62_05505 [Aestuariivita sp.]|nr:hypothetical protein [Aestuariivita sp.]